MTEPFIGEIRAVGFSFAPQGWALCNGQILPLASNTALFSLLGTTYGGDGKTTFALPNLQGATPVQQGQGPGLSLVELGETGGQASVTLQQSELASHTHGVNVVSGGGGQNDPTNAYLGSANSGGVEDLQYAPTADAPMASAALSVAGGGQPHNNLSPYLVVNFIIALQGIYPPRD
jgi:microcystin-dependent protein